MPCSGCSALHGVNPNQKKKKKKYQMHFFKRYFIIQLYGFQNINTVLPLIFFFHPSLWSLDKFDIYFKLLLPL